MHRRLLPLHFLLLEIICSCTALRRQKGLRSVSRRGDPVSDDDAPYCVYGPRLGLSGNFTGDVQVFIGQDNERSLGFGSSDMGTQTSVSCGGAVPEGCKNSRAAQGKDPQSCEMLGCDCKPDSSNLEFVYMTKMMDQVLAMCLVKSQDMKIHPEEEAFKTLIIGLGGGALPDYLVSHCPKSKVEAVEYDPRVVDVATMFFGLKLEAGKMDVETKDGGEAVRQRVENGQKYDVVLVDAFLSGGVVPESCRSPAFIGGLKNLLKPGGKAIQQVWAGQYDKMLADYKQAFGEDNTKGENVQLDMNFLVIADIPSE